jgi:hypothetical protein
VVRQVIGQVATASGRFRGGWRFRFSGGELGLDPGDVRLQLLQPQVELIRIEPLGAPAEDGALHLPKLLAQGFQFRQVGLLALHDLGQIAHQLLEQGGVGGQVVQVEAHGRV